MATIKQVYENAAMLHGLNRKNGYGEVRENIERVVMVQRKYNWKDEATDNFYKDVLAKSFVSTNTESALIPESAPFSIFKY